MTPTNTVAEIDWTPVKVRLGDLSHWADNPVTLSKAQAKKLLRSKEKLGKMQTLAIGPSNGDGKYPLYDGHQRANVWGTAFGMGLEVWALQSSRPLTDDERHAVPIMLRTAAGSLDWDALAGWTDYPLGEWGLDEDALDGLKFDIAALGNLLESEAPEPADAEPQIDRAEELNKKWQVKMGDLWRIGEHRLLCGDSTRREDVEGVMQGVRAAMVFADPPFGIAYTGHGASKDGRANKFEPIVGDKIPNADWLQLFTLQHGAIYLKTHWDVLEFWKSAIEKVARVKSIITWDRCSHSAGDVVGGYATQSELIIFAVFDNHKLNKFDTDIWRIERATTGAPEQRTGHPYESPVGLPKRAIENSTQLDDVILDPFVGSGTTIIACQNLRRKCRAIEISPAYCAVTLQRMQDAFPGIEIARIE